MNRAIHSAHIGLHARCELVTMLTNTMLLPTARRIGPSSSSKESTNNTLEEEGGMMAMPVRHIV